MALTKVTQIIQDIGKCRDAVTSKDIKVVLSRIYLIEDTWKRCKRFVNKFVLDPSYELDFTYMDLAELSDEIQAFLENWLYKFSFTYSVNLLDKYEKIDAKAVKDFYAHQCEYMMVDAKLREAHKIFGYLATILWLFTVQKENNEDFSEQIASTIRSFL